MRLLEPVTALVKDQLGVVARVQDQQVQVFRVADVGAARHKLLQINVDEGALPGMRVLHISVWLHPDHLEASLVRVEIGNWVRVAVDFDDNVFLLSNDLLEVFLNLLDGHLWFQVIFSVEGARGDEALAVSLRLKRRT